MAEKHLWRIQGNSAGVDEGLGEEEANSLHTDPEPESKDEESSKNIEGLVPMIPNSSNQLPTESEPTSRIPNYKLLYRTHIILKNRLQQGLYRFSTLQRFGNHPPHSHNSTIYCVQLHNLSNRQVVFSGSKDTRLLMWDLERGQVERIFSGPHTGSVLGICALGDDIVVSGGGDARVVIWSITQETPFIVLNDHLDSVLSVRMDEHRLVSCSKGT